MTGIAHKEPLPCGCATITHDDKSETREHCELHRVQRLPGPMPVEVMPVEVMPGATTALEERVRELEQRLTESEKERRNLTIAKYALLDRVRGQHEDHLETIAAWRSQSWALLGQVIYQHEQAMAFVRARNESWREGRRNYERARNAERERDTLRAELARANEARAEIGRRISQARRCSVACSESPCGSCARYALNAIEFALAPRTADPKGAPRSAFDLCGFCNHSRDSHTPACGHQSPTAKNFRDCMCIAFAERTA